MEIQSSPETMNLTQPFWLSIVPPKIEQKFKALKYRSLKKNYWSKLLMVIVTDLRHLNPIPLWLLCFQAKTMC